MDQIRKRKIFLTQLNQEFLVEFNLNSTPMNSDQIEELARLNPVKVSDLEAIKGLGNTFQQKYGELLITRLQYFNLKETNLDQSDQIHSTLNELQKRLINISKRNRLLYVAKTSPKTTFDLAHLKNEGLNSLLFESKKVKLIDLSDENSKDAYNSLNEIHKNVNKAYKETGNYDLYIATPFVSGEFVSDPFTLRAPLALFPIQLEITNKAVFVHVDNEKDVLINTNLIVAAQNFLKTNLPLIPMNLEEINPTTFLEDLLKAYEQQGLQVALNQEELKPFESKTIESFKSNKPGLFEVENVALLGYFPILSTSIQRDYAKINQLSSYPPHVLTLLETINHTEESTAIELEDVVFNEQHLAYINALNTSQEQAQLQIKKGQHIVIQGPPGTGKSQTISNVIAQSVFDKKNILMVSEKKAAIDVVYSRLGNLNQYALILDNINDKLNFYTQCERLFNDQITLQKPQSIDRQNSEMNNLISDLSRIRTLLLTPLADSFTPIDLYTEVTPIDYSNPDIFKEYQFLKETVNSDFLSQYSLLRTMNIDTDLEEIINYIKLKQQLPAIERINLNLSDYDIMSLQNKLPTAINDLKNFEQSGFFHKLLNKRKEQDLLEPFNQLIKNITLSDINSIKLILENYKQISQPLIIDYNENFLFLIDKIKQQTKESYQNAFKRLKNFIGFELIQDFENKNRDIHELIKDYPQIVHSFNASVNEKSDLLNEILGFDLHMKRFELSSSKRALEMKRIIERKRKWSISKFVDKFYVELFDGVKIWLCTPDVVSEIFPLKPDLFDVLIFDEASQLYIEKAIPSILRSKQVIIAGDSQQLRPSAFGVGRFGYDEEMDDEFIDSTAALDEESLLDLARFKFPAMTLNYHYRSLYEELIAYSNSAFYKNQLVVSPNALTQSLPPIQRIKVENGRWIKRTNQQESDAVVKLIKEISETRQNNETIGVITFNATQRSLIEADLEKLATSDKAFGDFYQQECARSKDNQDLSLFVKNIENVQGDERDIIIFSITYAPDENGKVPSFFGWLSQQGGQNRLNVAITRAKRQIYVVTSIEPHQLPVANSSAIGPSLLQQYLSYSKAISENDSASVQLILNKLTPSNNLQLNKSTVHPLTQVVIDYLNTKGYTVKHHYGISHFTIECAVFKDDVLLGGFEFDHDVYKHIPTNDRQRDIHQPNYLKARGWKVHRLFSYDYYHSKEEFLNKLEQLLVSDN